MNTPRPLSERAKALRKLSGLSQAEFAKKLFISRGLYNGIETGREKNVSPWIVQQLDLLERVGIKLLDKIDAPPGEYEYPVNLLPVAGAGALQQDQEPYGSIAEIRREIRGDVEKALAAAGDDRNRLGWLKVQVAQHLTPPAQWLTHDQRNAEAVKLAETLREKSKQRGDAGRGRAAS